MKDLLRFRQFALRNPDLKPFELINAYNLEYPELTAKQKIANIEKAIGMSLSDLFK